MALFTFEAYSESERQRITSTVRRLTIAAPTTSFKDYGIALSANESWLRGSLHEVLRKVDEVTRKTVDIGRHFVNKAPNDPARMRRFYWKVDYPHPNVTCALDIGLVLVSVDPTVGNLILAQQVLRSGEDEFIYWGVD